MKDFNMTQVDGGHGGSLSGASHIIFA